LLQNSLPQSGLAALQDLEHPEFKSLLFYLEAIQQEFLALRPHSPAYRWPKDALHTWSRVWEYPYVLHHVRRWREESRRSCTPVILDFGSGVTFFPFALARDGMSVICADIEIQYGHAINRAARQLPVGGGTVRFQRTFENTIPLDSASVDLIYSISVLEHMKKHEGIVAELARVLRPSGRLILTVDVDLVPGSDVGLSPWRHTALRACLDRYFDSSCGGRHVSPSSLLTTSNSPFPYAPGEESRRAPKAWSLLKEHLLKPLLGRRKADGFLLACEGSALVKPGA
jgi:SAM-dependent methyltransferase